MLIKFFDNNYGSHDVSNEQINLNLEDSLQINSYENKIDYDIVFDKIYAFFESHSELKLYLLAEEKRKVTNVQLNNVYSIVSKIIPKEFHIEMFIVLGELIDVNLSKFYDILSNKFKIDLISTLKERGYLLKQYSLF